MILELNRQENAYLKVQKSHDFVTPYETMTLKEIMHFAGGTRVTAYRKLKRICELGYMAKGCKSAQADTYYITKKGLRIFEREVN